MRVGPNRSTAKGGPIGQGNQNVAMKVLKSVQFRLSVAYVMCAIVYF